MKYLDRIANAAIIVAVAIFITLVIRGEFPRRSSAPDHSPSALLGRNINLPGVPLPEQRDSLVLGISTTCHFCTESLPFYKQLTDRAQGRIEVFAVLPQTQNEATKYLAGAGLSNIHEISADLGAIGVYATPTLLLIDSRGKIKSAWVGKQDEVNQQKILATVSSHELRVVPRS